MRLEARAHQLEKKNKIKKDQVPRQRKDSVREGMDTGEDRDTGEGEACAGQGWRLRHLCS